MICAEVGAPYAAEAVAALNVVGTEEALGDHAPLYGYVLAVIHRHGLVDAPACRHVVEYDVLAAAAAQGIVVAATLVAQAHTYIAYYHLVGGYAQRIALYADAVAGSGLSGYGYVGVAYCELFLQVDGARHAEHHRARPLGLNGMAQAALARVVEVGNFVDVASAAAYGKLAIALGRGESLKAVGHAQSRHEGGCNRKYKILHGSVRLVLTLYRSYSAGTVHYCSTSVPWATLSVSVLFVHGILSLGHTPSTMG